MGAKENNKKVIRKEKVDGAFTTIHHSILNDKRLTPIAFRILTSILSDSDEYFSVSQELLIKRFGIHKDTVRKAFKNLEECGYLKRTELRRGHFYTISEFGNLNKNSPETMEDIEIITDPEEIERHNKEIRPEITEFLNQESDYFNLIDNDTLTQAFIDATANNGLIQVDELKKIINSIFNEKKKEVYDHFIDFANSKSSNTNMKKALEDYKKWLKNVIYEQKEIPEKGTEKWLQIKTKYRTTKVDYEIRIQDEMEQRFYDGDDY